MTKNIFTIALASLFLITPAIAEETPQVEKPSAETKQSLEQIRQDMFKKLGEISDKLEGAEKHHFNVAYNNYSLISTVRTVQKDVGGAITACGENNPDIKDKLDTRFKQWNDTVNPVMSEAQGHLDNMVLVQTYAPAKDIRGVFKVMDDARDKAETEIKKIPVTTPEACQYLLDKMDETQENMVKILRLTLTSHPLQPTTKQK